MNNEQKIIGTWVSPYGKTKFVFNANGTAILFDNSEVQFSVIDTILAYEFPSGGVLVYNISISSDGKTLIMDRTDNDKGYLLTKK